MNMIYPRMISKIYFYDTMRERGKNTHIKGVNWCQSLRLVSWIVGLIGWTIKLVSFDFNLSKEGGSKI